jgi:hypothetical protein
VERWYLLNARVANVALMTRRSTSGPMRDPIRLQSASCVDAERPASPAQSTGSNLADQRIHSGSRLACMRAVERKVSGSVTRLTIPIRLSRSRIRTATRERGEDLHRRRLPRAVRAEEAEDRSGGHFEVEAAERSNPPG